MPPSADRSRGILTTTLTSSWIDRLLRPAMPESGAICEKRTNQEP